MKYSEFRRWLERQGELTSVFPDHGAKEMGKALSEKIKKDLGLK